jgi:hypothetical protein
MRQTTIRLAIAAAMIALSGVRVAAAPPPATASVQTSAPPIAKTKTTVAKPKAAKTKTAAKKKAAKKSTKKKTAAKGSTAAGVTASPAPAAAPGPWKPGNPVAHELSSKPGEVARARRVLPVGTDLNAATTGFRNYSQFAAAINATESKNLDFGKLKSLMTGVNMDGSRTHRPTMSLSQATQALHGTATTPPGGSP